MTELTAMTSERPVTDTTDSLIPRNLWVAVLSGVAVIMFNTMPVFLGAAGETLGWTGTRLGGLISAYFAGNTLTYLVVGFTINRLNWVVCTRIAAMVAAVVFVLMALVVSPDFYPFLMFVAGLGGGTIYVFAMTALACSERPARNIGLGFLFQLSFGAVVVFLFPVVVTPHWGFDGVLLSFAILFVIAALLSSALQGKKSQGSAQGRGIEFKPRPLLALFGLVVFFAGMTALWAFMERIGDSAGFSKAFVGTVLSVSLFFGGLASLLTIVLDNRWGYRLPVTIAGVLVVLALMGLGYELNTMTYALGVMTFQFSWVLGVNYIAATISHVDSSGRYTAFLPGGMGVASMIGPVVAGVLIGSGIMPLILMGGACAIVTIALFNLLLKQSSLLM